MKRRKYKKIQELLPEIEKMIQEGKSHKEIEEYYGLTGDRPVHNLLKRERRKRRNQEKGIVPRPKGRPRKRECTTLEECQQEIQRLKMENELLRDFLQYTGRR